MHEDERCPDCGALLILVGRSPHHAERDDPASGCAPPQSDSIELAEANGLRTDI